MAQHTVQLELPDAPNPNAHQVAQASWLKIIMAVVQLIGAISTGNPAAIVAAIQALINAISGQ